MNKGMLNPKEIAFYTADVGYAKAVKSPFSILLLGVLAGIYIALGSVGYTTLMAKINDPGLAKLLGAAVFPVGLMLVIIGGAELFTGNCLMVLGLISRKYNVSSMVKNWGLVYIGNLIGSLFMVYIIIQTGLYTGSLAEKSIIIASDKVSLTLSQVISRAILCNILVAMAVYLSYGAKDVVGKIFSCWFPVMLFVLCGYEHSIANMFLIPVAKFLGADITWTQIWLKNIIPATIGNIIGGGILIPIFYYLIYIKEHKEEVSQNA